MAPGSDMRCLRRPSLPTVTLSRLTSRVMLSSRTIVWLNVSAMRPSMPGQSAGRRAEKSPSRNATNAFKIWRERTSADLVSCLRLTGGCGRFPFGEVAARAAVRVRGAGFSFIFRLPGERKLALRPQFARWRQDIVKRVSARFSHPLRAWIRPYFRRKPL